ncbi:Os05g0108200 [Oryza sativa Japonica Group]|uniref:Os05g0108200 protein n=1 Tax=Oryza sativa subsp. japonica TaxID=39947 RepID=A0A0P0WGY3_ORYSJ|nr:hypothetical protein EE612_026590 [Oryza sativa]BAS91894.1 Os05g0108200 [Oryza sativa Japonica Group]
MLVFHSLTCPVNQMEPLGEQSTVNQQPQSFRNLYLHAFPESKIKAPSMNQVILNHMPYTSPCISREDWSHYFNKAEQQQYRLSRTCLLTCGPRGHLFFLSSAMSIPDQALNQVERSPDGIS